MTDDSEHLWGIIRILERSCASRSERIDELEAENRDLRSALATIAEQNAGAESCGSGGRAAEEPAGGGGDAGVAPPPAAKELRRKIADLLSDWIDNETRPDVATGECREVPSDEIAGLILALLPQPPARICLVCGASEQCMTEADLKPGDPGVPCTFDPTPQEIADAIRQRNEMIDELSKLLEVGPTMPEEPSEVILSAISDEVAAMHDGRGGRCEHVYDAIRAALAKEQGR